LKTLILRDWWLCTVISIMFEILEYTLEHQLPNFSECWWDHVRTLNTITLSRSTLLHLFTVDYGRTGLQRTWHFPRHPNAEIFLDEDILLAWAVEYTDIQVLLFIAVIISMCFVHDFFCRTGGN